MNNRCTLARVGKPAIWMTTVSAFLLLVQIGPTLSLIAISCFPATFLLAQEPSGTVSENNDLAIQELERLRSIDYHDMRFGDILEQLAEQTGLRFELHETAIDSNLDIDTPYSKTIQSTRLATILDLLLEPFQCTYSIKDGIVMIVGKDYANENPDMEVLNCQVLLASIQPQQEFFDGNPPSAPKAPQPKLEGGGLGGVVFAIPIPQAQGDPIQQVTQQEKEPAVEVEVLADDASPGSASVDEGGGASKPISYYRTIEPRERLVNLIRDTIDRDSWKENGNHASIIELNGLLVIRQTAHNIREIRILLERLEAGGLK